MKDYREPLLGQRKCPTCGDPYTPTAAKYAYRPRGTAESESDGKARLDSITYFGDCPRGHLVRETVEA